jgi:hypothetical protein
MTKMIYSELPRLAKFVVIFVIKIIMMFSFINEFHLTCP